MRDSWEKPEGDAVPIPLFLPHQLISPEFALSLVAPYKLPGLKSFNCPPGNAPVLGVKGKFLCAILFSEDCWLCLDFKSGLSKNNNGLEIQNRQEHSWQKTLTSHWDLTIWDAVLGKHLIWVRFVCYRDGEGESSLEPLGSEGNCNHRINTHLATSSETDRAFLRRTVLSSGLLLGEGHREGKDWAGLSFSAFSMFSVCWHWNKRAKVMVLEGLGEKRPKISVCISTQGIRKGLWNKCCPHRHSTNLITETHFWKAKWG